MSDLYGEQYLSEEAEDFIDALEEHNEMKADADKLEQDFLSRKPGEVIERYHLTGCVRENKYCTCDYCEDSDTCEFAFDPYNTNGDCLAIK